MVLFLMNTCIHHLCCIGILLSIKYKVIETSGPAGIDIYSSNLLYGKKNIIKSIPNIAVLHQMDRQGEASSPKHFCFPHKCFMLPLPPNSPTPMPQ